MIFLKNFQNQFVEVVAKTGMITQEGQAPLISHGFVIDADSDFIYLGINNSIQIDSAVSRKDIVYICITDPDVLEMNMFGGIGGPETDEEIN